MEPVQHVVLRTDLDLINKTLVNPAIFRKLSKAPARGVSGGVW